MAKKIVRSIFLLVLIVTSMGCAVQLYSDQPPPSAPIPPRGTPYDVSYFYDQLEPYGDWYWFNDYGWCWNPSDVPFGWIPYSDGYWINTDFGLTWVSDWDWGWACFHYGRWFFDSFTGWCWVPGIDWAPAWCAWRYGDGWIGWAPLPPQVGFRAGFGIEWGGIDIDTVIRPYNWCFAEERELYNPGRPIHIVSHARNVTIMNQTRLVTNYAVEGNRIINRSIPDSEIERTLRKPLPRYNVVNVNSPSNWRKGPSGRDVAFVRPPFREATPSHEPKRGIRENRALVESQGQPGRTSERPSEMPQGQAQERATVRTHEPAPERTAPAQAPSQAQEQRRIEQSAAQQEMMKRHEMQMQELQRRQQLQQKDLNRMHQRELQSPPPNVRMEELRQQHEAERRALEEQMQSEKQLLQRRQERERQQGYSRPAPQGKKK